MKKLLFSLIVLVFTGLCFANTPILEYETKFENEVQNFNFEIKKGEANIFCVWQCSRVIGGVTYTAEAGNFLSTCAGAAERCEKKLNKLSVLNTTF